MKHIYFDNAASTPIDPEVHRYMLELMEVSFGNPSSTHAQGRKAKVKLEASRKSIAKNLGCLPAEIVFCSGGTEADNAAIAMAVMDLKVERIISSPMEHHAVLHAAERWAKAFNIELELLNVDAKGRIDLDQLEEKLATSPKPTLVSLMHGNNEVGNMIDLKVVGDICHAHDAYFHSDTVQTMGHFPISLSDLPVDMVSASAHKFHGPKGVGFLYLDRRLKVSSLITGGSQERGMRGGTENIAQIGGLARALEISCSQMASHKEHILGLKNAFWKGIKALFPQAYANGLSDEMENSLYTVLNVSIPELSSDSMLLFNLDLKGIAASGGSACSSGSVSQSHVISAMNLAHTDPVIRFSFSRNNTLEEVDQVLQVLSEMKPKTVA